MGIAAKGAAVPGWPGYVVGRGPSLAAIELGYGLAMRFPTFDELLAGVEAIMPAEVAMLNLSHFDSGAAETIELVLAGFSASRGGPEAYLIRTTDHLPPGMSRQQFDAMRAENIAAGRSVMSGAAYTLERLPNVAIAPNIPQEARTASGYAGIDPDEPDGTVMNDMLLAIELQRQQVENGAHFVGGMAVLTKITPTSTTQKVVKRWEGDQIGQPIEAEPITDWKRWKGSAAVEAAAIPEGLSRLQRERMQKKAKKGTLRAV